MLIAFNQSHQTRPVYLVQFFPRSAKHRFRVQVEIVPLAWLEALPQTVVRARKEEGANAEDVTELLVGCNIENYECEAKRHNSEITAKNSNCYAQVRSL